jgi:hypothetical protein
MPKTPRQRDYAKEYADRVKLERERASAEGRPFSLSRARGHARGREDENARRRVRNLWRKNRETFGSKYPGWDSVKASADNYSWQDVEKVLRDQQGSINAYRQGDPQEGRAKYYAGKSSVYPIEFFWYHGN